jgi:2-polyprenyl-3-methyl-5-hydroxy-6-metoxy-1,4-benzoquinol methylase
MRAGEKETVLLVAAPRTATVGACPLCGSTKCSFKFQLPDRLHGVPGEFTYRRCHDCRTVFQDPRVVVEDLSLCYPDEYCTHQPPDADSAQIATTVTPQTDLRLRARLRRAVIDAVRQAPGPGAIGRFGGLLAKSRRLRERAFYGLMDELIPTKPGATRALEVGCGAGKLLKILAQAGWQVEGVEWDERAAEIARRTTGLQVTVGDFQNTALSLATYDLVVLHHVLEHLPDTLGCLRKIAEILAPGGRAVLIYPNLESLGARIFREDWLHWDPPRHVVLPAAKAIGKAANAIGLVTVSLKSSARYARVFIAHSMRYRRREALKPNTVVSTTFQDRLLAGYEYALVKAGFMLGEELVIALEKPHLSKKSRGKKV